GEKGRGVEEAEEAKTKQSNGEPPQDVVSAGLLSSIDEKLKSQGFEPSKVEAPPTANQAPQQESVKKVELGAKVAVEKGPLFLTPTEIPAQAKASSTGTAANPENNPESSEKPQVSEERTEFPRTLVNGPTEPPPLAKIAEPKRPVS